MIPALLALYINDSLMKNFYLYLVREENSPLLHSVNHNIYCFSVVSFYPFAIAKIWSFRWFLLTCLNFDFGSYASL